MFLCCYANKEGYLIFSNPKTTLCVLIHHPEFPKFTVRRSLVTVLLAPIYISSLCEENFYSFAYPNLSINQRADFCDYFLNRFSRHVYRTTSRAEWL